MTVAIYKKSSGVQGAFVDKTVLKNGQKATIVSETEPVPSNNFVDKNGAPQIQNIAKVKFEGVQDTVNVSINKANINALIDAFGEDSKLWMNKELTVEVEKVRVGGRAVIALYLIPAGYIKIDNADGYAEIIKDTESAVKATPKSKVNADEDDEDSPQSTLGF